MLGILLIDKPLGVSSHDVVNMVRSKLGVRRVGHAGTLDPLGTGLLVVAAGPATRFLQYLSLEPKVYEAQATFGQESNTQDGEGALSDPKPVPFDLEAQLAEVVPAFYGLIEQLPPMFSAVKIKGRALYHYARKGEEVEREPRTVFIEKISVRMVDPPKVRIEVVCSGGTYMRTLVHDIGQLLGCGAYLSGLSRTRCGAFHLADAVTPDGISPERLLSLEQALLPMPVIVLNETQAGAIRQGQRIGIQKPMGTSLVALKYGGEVIGVAQAAGNQLQPECVLPMEAGIGAL